MAMAMANALLCFTKTCNIRGSAHHDLRLDTRRRHPQTKAVMGNVHFTHAKRLKEIKHVLAKAPKDSKDTLLIIDAIQKFGIEYHFEEEIEAALQEQHLKFGVVVDGGNYGELELHEVALQFRLLRQHGYHVRSDVFKSFMEHHQESAEDIMGLISLYEASQLGIEGEDCLDEARSCCYELLNAWISRNEEHHHANSIIRNVLQFPSQKSVSRLAARSFNICQTCQGANDQYWLSALEDLAKMEASIVKPIYHREVLEITKWWKELALAKDLKLVRKQPLKWYLWVMMSITDPSLSEQRVALIKPIAMVYVIDDIFDIYGTIEELTLFTDVVQRWDLAGTKELPEYMKICFKTLDDITNDFSSKIMAKHGWNPKPTLQKEWGRLCNAFLVESKWLMGAGNLPKAEEYLKNGIISSGVQVVLSHSFFLLGEAITDETVNIISDNPRIISCTATILRLCDDLQKANEVREGGGRDGSYVECYMNEHKGIPVEEARKQVNQMVADAWKGLNQEYISGNPLPKSFKKVCLNSARMVSLMYGYDDDEGLPRLEHHLKSLLEI